MTKMTPQELKSEKAAQAIVGRLVEITGVRAPKVYARTRSGALGGEYYRGTEIVAIYRTSKNIAFEGNVIHEFQHHLDNLNGVITPNPDHGADFSRRVNDLFNKFHGYS